MIRVTKDDKSEIVRTRDKVDNITGPGVEHQLRSVRIDLGGSGRSDRSAPAVWFNARLETATQDGTNKRWTYDFIELTKTSAGYGGWSDMNGGRTGTAYNKAEAMNGASGLYGNGVNSANLTGTFDIKPIPEGRMVEIEMVAVGDDTTEFWFVAENGIDGECS